MRSMIALAALLTIGCATLPADQENGVVTGCNAERGESLVGRPASQDLGADALRLTGARRLRWIRPGDMVTMDFSPDRLNIHLDAQNRVARLACG